MLKTILSLIILALAFPIGYLLARLTREELVSGRIWFKLIVFISSISAIIFLFYNLAVSLTLVFISIVSLISLIKSYNRKFIK
ncbi:MAG: hypothetical protein ABIG37_02990 [Nanoarchaeota archaeon]|nr:hypothetical protein [Nanoarchaeota archaeon]